MVKKKVGELIKEARTNAGLSQAALAKETGVSAADIGKAERGEKELTQAQLKLIAKATGVTQKSLLEAASGTSSSAKKTGTAAAKKTGTTAKKTSGTSMTLTATEKKFLELYRAADADTKKAAASLLKGESVNDTGLLGSLLGKLTGAAGRTSVNNLLNYLTKEQND